MPARLSREQRMLGSVSGVSMNRARISRSRQHRQSGSGGQYIVERADQLERRGDQAANAYGMVMAFSGLRLFHH